MRMDAAPPATLLRAWLLCTTALLGFGAPALAQAPGARPTGGQVVAGQASIAQSAAQTTITQGSDRAAIDWRSFDIGRQHHVQFRQPGAGSWTLNRVNAPDPSMIAGRISATGGVAIVNQSGVVFAQGAQVNVGSLIASAAGITTNNFMAGRMVFDGPPRPGAVVANHGTITVADRGLVALAGPRVANSGVIRARLGKVALAGAESFKLDLAGDGLLAIEVTGAVRTAPNGATALVTNSGVIEAQGGSVLLTAHAASGLVEDLVRNTGRIAANTAGGRTGAITVQAEGGNAVLGGTLRATGGAGQRGGNVTATATGTVRVAAGAVVDASGGAGGGDVALRGGRTRVEGRVLSKGTGPGARGGAISVQATQAVTLAAGAVVDASGMAGGGRVLLGTTGFGREQTMAAETRIARGATVRADAIESGDGGTIAVNSIAITRLLGRLSARGAARGGNGGFIEVSGRGAVTLPSLVRQVDLAAPAGRVGTLLLDPTAIVIALAGDPVGGDVVAGDPPDPGTLTLAAADVGNFAGNLLLEAEERITVDADGAFTKATGDLILRTTGAGDTLGPPGIFIGADVALTAGTLTLTSATGITIGAAVSAGGAVIGTAAAGAITVGGTVTGGTGVNLNASGAVTTTAAVLANAGDVVLTGSSISLNAAVTAAAGTIDLTATAGGIAQNGAGVLTATALRAQATGSVALATAANALTTLAGRSAGAFAFTNTQSLTVGTVLDTAGIIATDAGAAVTVNVTGAGNDLTVGNSVIAPGALTLTAADALTLNGAGVWALSLAGQVTVTAGGTLTNAGVIYAAGTNTSSVVRSAGAGGIVNSGTIVLGDPNTGNATTAGIVEATAGAIDNQATTGRIVAGTVGRTGFALTNAGQIGTRAAIGSVVTNSGTLVALDSVTFTSLANTGTLATNGSITLTAGLTNGATATLIANALTVTGALTNAGTIKINTTASATGAVTNSGSLIATTLSAGGLLTNSGTLNAVAATGGTGVTNSGTLTATTLTATTGDITNTSTGRIEEGTVTVAAVAVSVATLLDAATALAEAVAGNAYAPTIAATGGAAVPATDGNDIAGGLDLGVTASAGAVANAGRIIASRNLNVAAALDLTNGVNAWLLAGGGTLTATAGGTLTNAGVIYAAGTNTSSSVRAAAITNSGTIVLGDPNTGNATTAGIVEATAGAIDNPATTGRIVAGTVGRTGFALTNAGQIGTRAAIGSVVTNSGTLVALDSVTFTSLANSGTLATNGSITLTAGLTNGTTATLIANALTVTGALTNAGTIKINTTASATGAVTNSGSLIATTLTAGGLLTNSGILHAVTATGGTGVTNSGTLTATTLTATTGSVENTVTGRIEEGTVTVAPVAVNIATLIDAAAARTQAIAGAAYTVTITPTGGATVPATVGNNIAGGLNLGVTATTGTISNAGRIMALGALTVTAGANIRNGAGLLNGAAETTGAWLLAGSGALTATAGGDVQNAGVIYAAGANTSSVVRANGAGGIINRGTIVLGDPSTGDATTAGIVEATAGAIDNQAAGRIVAGRVAASGALTNAGQSGVRVASAGGLLNNSGTLVALDSVAFGSLVNTGTLATNGSITITAGGLSNASGASLFANALAVTGALNNGGTIRINTTASATGDITNSGLLVATTLSAGGLLTNTNTGTLHAVTATGGTGVTNSGTLTATTLTATTGNVENIANLGDPTLGRIEEGTVTVAPVGVSIATLIDAATARTQAIAGTPYTVTITPTGGADVPPTVGNDIAGGLNLGVAAPAGTVSNAGRIMALGALTVTAGANIRNGAGLLNGAAETTGAWLLAGTGALTATAATASVDGDIQNAGTIYAAGANTSSVVRTTGTGGIVNRGTIVLGDPNTGDATTAGIVEATAGAIDNQAAGRIVAGRLTAFGALTNAGVAAARTITAGDFLNNTGTLIALRSGAPLAGGSVTARAGLTNGASAFLFADTLAVTGDLTNNGSVQVTATASATGAVTNGGLLVATTLGAGELLTNTGTLQAVTATAGGGVTNSGTLTATTLTATGGDVQNSGRIEEGVVTATLVGFATDPLPNAATARAQAVAGTAYSPTITPSDGATVPPTVGDDIAGGLDLTVASAGSLINTGRIMASRALTVTAGANITNSANAWLLAGTGALTVTTAGGTITNAGTIYAAGSNTSSAVQAAAITNSGSIVLGDPTAPGATATSAGVVAATVLVIDNQATGRIVAGRLAALGAITNAGQATARAISAGGLLTNTGTLVAVRTGTPPTDGSVTAGAGLTNGAGASLLADTLTVTGALTNFGTLLIDATASTTGDVANSGLLIAPTLTAGGLLTNTGTLHTVTATAGTGVTNSGTLTATTLTAVTGNLENTATGRLEEGTVTSQPAGFSVATLLDAATARTQAVAGAAYTLTITPTGGATVPATVGNDIAGGLDLAVAATAGTVSNAGRILATRNLTVTAGANLRNGAGLLNGAAETTAAWLLAGTGTLTAIAGGDIQNAGTIFAAGSGTSSVVRANGAGGIVNRGGIVLGDPSAATATTAGIVEAIAGPIDNQAAGRIGAGTVGRAVNALTNAGQLGARLANAATLTNTGLLVALDTLTLSGAATNAGTVLTQALTGTGALAVNGGTVRATAVTLGGDIVVSPGGLLVAPVVTSAAGSVLVGGTLQATTVQAGADVRTTASGAVIEATTVTAVTGSLINVGGARIAQGTAAATLPVLALGGVVDAATARATALGGVALPVALGAAGGSVAAGGADLAVAAPAGTLSNAGVLAAAGALTATAGGSLLLLDGAGVNAETARLAGAVASIGNVTATIGRTLLVQAPGGIGAAGRLTIRPRDGRLPAVAFDTRTAPPPGTLALLEPDTAGVQAADQRVQVREPGAEVPGTFGPSLGTPAAPIGLNVDAGQSAVFLLLDGGVATGSIIAGRLGIHGTAGSAELTGQLGGFGGVQAATRADVTRPIDPLVLSRYRVNGCAASSINCTVFTSGLIAPPRPPERLTLTVDNSRLDTSEVTVPNVSDTDLP